MLKISNFYLDKQKSFIPKKIEVYHVPWIALISAKRWRLDVLTFLIYGFVGYDTKIKSSCFVCTLAIKMFGMGQKVSSRLA